MSVFQFPIFLENLFSAAYLKAGIITLWISLASLIVGLLLGVVLALAQESRFAPVRAGAAGYLWLFRGTPVLLQIVFAFNVLPSFGIVLPGYACAVLALGLNEAAYMAEIMRAGISAVPVGQREAARALGLNPWLIMRLVVLPQAVRVVIPAIANQFISMLKVSALVSVIGVQELLLIADQAAASNFRYFEALSAAGCYYLVMTTIFMLAQKRIERALRPDQPRSRAPSG